MKKTFIQQNGRSLRKGQGLVEYIFMVGLIAILAYAAISGFGNQVKNAFNTAGGKVSSASQGQ